MGNTVLSIMLHHVNVNVELSFNYQITYDHDNTTMSALLALDPGTALGLLSSSLLSLAVRSL
jgi:hypothetical protein